MVFKYVDIQRKFSDLKVGVVGGSGKLTFFGFVKKISIIHLSLKNTYHIFSSFVKTQNKPIVLTFSTLDRQVITGTELEIRGF